MSIDTEIPGSRNSVETLADWVKDDFQAGLIECETESRNGARDSTQVWISPWSNAYQERLWPVVDDMGLAIGRAHLVWDYMMAYAEQLEWHQEYMEGALEEARFAGLETEGALIHSPGQVRPPVHHPSYADDHWEALQRQYREDLGRLDEYVRIRGNVARIRQSLADWIELRLGGALAGFPVPPRELQADLDAWDVAGTSISVGDSLYSARAAERRERVDRLLEEGVPETGRGPSNTGAAADRASTIARRFTIVGYAVDAAEVLSGGADLTEVVLGIVVEGAVGAATTNALLRLGSRAFLAGLGGGLAGIVAAEGASAIYDWYQNNRPLHDTQERDEELDELFIVPRESMH